MDKIKHMGKDIKKKVKHMGKKSRSHSRSSFSSRSSHSPKKGFIPGKKHHDMKHQMKKMEHKLHHW